MWGAPLQLVDGDFEVSFDRKRYREAAAVVFHIPEWRNLRRHFLPPKQSGQVWVAWSKECAKNYPLLEDPRFLQRFELTMTYRLNCDVPIPYVDEFDPEELRQPGSPKSKPLVCAFLSSRFNRSRRLQYFDQLCRWIEVDSYGKYRRNCRLEPDLGRSSKVRAMARYPFTLAFENACGVDYVTEKLYDPMRAGSLPGSMGAPNANWFAPAPKSYIDVRDFATPRHLAQYLIHLSQNPAEYDAYFEWKDQPFQASFQALLSWQSNHWYDRLCGCLAGFRRGIGNQRS